MWAHIAKLLASDWLLLLLTGSVTAVLVVVKGLQAQGTGSRVV